MVNNKHYNGWISRIDELINIGLLKNEQKDGLINMIKSSDKENFLVAHEILKLKMGEKLIEGLNNGQTVAFASIIEFFNSPEQDAFVLKGYAGTGKTFLVKQIIEFIANSYPNRKIAITAPTNKAVQVLQSDTPFDSENTQGSVFKDLFNAQNRIEYKTIHKLLGLKESITARGEQIFKPSKEDNQLLNFKYLIVDEVSMLNDTLCEEILNHSDKVKIIFMGDPAQIPPVNNTECIPFREDHDYNFASFTLNEIMRQKNDNPIVNLSFRLRNNLNLKQPIPVLETTLNNKGQGVVHFDSIKERDKVIPMLREYFNSVEFKNDSDYIKVIAWTNKTVDYMNSTIRRILYGDCEEPFVAGEKLIVSKPIFERVEKKWSSNWKIKFNTSKELEVENVKIQTINKHENHFSMLCKMYILKVKTFNPITKVWEKHFIEVIHDSDKKQWFSLLTDAKNKALRTRNKSDWVTYYGIMKWSANVSYNYAITAHKSQGSTYKNVLLIEEDLDFNRKVVERNRIKYTAYSRASDKLFILRKNFIV